MLGLLLALLIGGFYWFNASTHDKVNELVYQEHLKRSGPIVAKENPVFPKGSGYYAWGGPNANTVRSFIKKNRPLPKPCPSWVRGECIIVQTREGEQIFTHHPVPDRGDYAFVVSSENEISEKGYKSLLAEYNPQPQDHEQEKKAEMYDFSRSYPAALHKIKPIVEEGEKEYAVVFRDRVTDEITAIGYYYVVAEDEEDGKMWLRAQAHNIAPAALKEYIQGDEKTRQEIREEVKTEWEQTNPDPYVDLTSYPPVSEVKARDILRGYMQEVGIHPDRATIERVGEENDYAMLYAYQPVTDEYYGVFSISYEFIMNGKHRVWVGIGTGQVVDESQLQWIAEKNEWIARWNPSEEEVLAREYRRTKIYNE
jgi:hypothetical protein